ncbi:hypothetical protein [Cerasicoccus arenae]|uniref:SHOCT domain-containing protein n=1 Tax=Cerasicoccus arenae TaxID=424488 RepID=A0A8J3DE22_9BACT|nr:hypothetical protein [Cerasicoccus arenae]MBK1857374.1 hypothetical protein [Cerasicoccus arenae]GHC09090.1 hypothetical protein GCM10007047_27950 [Cerasicoccus arenae]
MKLLLIISAFAGLLIVTGCKTNSSEKGILPANETVSETFHQSPAEKKVFAMQQLDDKYKSGGMTEAEYNTRREEIIGQY